MKMKTLRRDETANIIIILFLCCINSIFDIVLVNNPARSPIIVLTNGGLFIAYSLLYISTKYMIKLLRSYERHEN
jgi:hypothetical protein